MPDSASAAVAMDARSRGFDPQQLPQLIRSVEGVEPEILYLDCSGTELMRRYDETRRRHPLAPDRPAEDGIARERQMTMPLRNAADSVLDTTDLSPAELRDELVRETGLAVELLRDGRDLRLRELADGAADQLLLVAELEVKASGLPSSAMSRTP